MRTGADLSRFLSEHFPGEIVDFSALREGEMVTGRLTLGNRPEG